jgi:hypothetical protein
VAAGGGRGSADPVVSVGFVRSWVTEEGPVGWGPPLSRRVLVLSFLVLTQSRTHHAAPFGAGLDYASRSRTLGRTYLGGPAARSEAPRRPSAAWLRSVRCHPAFARDVQLPTSWTPPGRDRRPRLQSYAAPRSPRWARVCTRGAQGLARH